MKIGVIGAGYVGTTTGLVLAKYGHEVTVIDNNVEKINKLNQSKLPFFEEEVADLLQEYLFDRRLEFTSKFEKAIKQCEIFFVTVGTPSLENGEADLSHVEEVIRNIGKLMNGYKVIIVKSTVPVGTGDNLKRILSNELAERKSEITFDLVSNPEFLREGKALHDALYPDRVIIGCESERAKRLMKELYKEVNTTIHFTTIKDAEMIKYASNAFLAAKISFINELARMCERLGVNVNQVAKGMGMDKRIGPNFLEAGIGYGGSCFPKDIKALLALGTKAEITMNLIQAVADVNQTQIDWFMEKVKKELGSLSNRRIALLGLTFKPQTDDIREAPSLKIIDYLLKNNTSIAAYDPKGTEHVKKIYPTIDYTLTPLDALKGADAALIITEWKEILDIDWQCAKHLLLQPLIFDGRNALDPSKMSTLGYRYIGVGIEND